jgi:hypothetical protein
VSGDPVLPGYVFEGRGPAQRRLLSWLRERVPDGSFDSAVAQRSPAGPWALKVHAPNRVPTCAELLQAEPWIERVTVRPQHLYVRIGCERLCEWVVEGYAAEGGAAACVGGSEGRGRSVLVRAVDVDAVAAAGAPRPLRMFRETAVARSVAALLRSRGFEVRLELLPPGRETYDDVWAAAPGSSTHTVVVGSGVPLPSEVERGDHVVQLPVGEVDVRHGPLRARNGGSVSADDVVAEVRRMLPAQLRSLLAAGEEAERACAEAIVALLLLATPRARRIQLDDAALKREVATFACLAAVLTGESHVDGDAGAPQLPIAAPSEPLRDLAAELDLIATNAARGTAALDPALVARSLRSLAERSERLAGGDATEAEAGGSDAVAAATPSWPVARAGIEAAFGLAGIDVSAPLHGAGAAGSVLASG